VTAYYNEIDPFAAAWLRNLIAENLIAPGDVDERSIADVRPADLKGYTQCHFFGGIGGWSYAARLAGLADDYPLWTGSCPCQPFSTAGKRKGQADERHLWPVFFDLIRQCRPERVFGEQVAGAIGFGWLDGISADLEAEGYACGSVVLGAHSVGAPHIRQRLYWVADAMRDRTGHASRQGMGAETAADGANRSVSGQRLRTGIEGSTSDGLAHTDGRDASAKRQQRGGEQRQQSQDGGAGERMGDTDRSDAQHGGREGRQPAWPRTGAILSPGHWGSAEYIQCSDGKARCAQPGIQPLAHGVPNRVGTLRGAGNAMVPQIAAVFIAATLQSRAGA
jgi:DNA (cytosine-5)-methyltransferase 1